jgi:hypothetical protein
VSCWYVADVVFLDISRYFSTPRCVWYSYGCCYSSSSLFRGTCSSGYWNIPWVRRYLQRTTLTVLSRTPDVVQEIKACSVLYKNNFCEGNIVPHMFQPCGEWETCMNRDPSKIGRARIGAQLLAEIVNAFVENISWKTFVSSFQFLRGALSKDNSFKFFSVVSLAFFTFFINSLFTFYRSKHYQTPHPIPVPMPQPQYVMPPQTPRRSKSGSKWKSGDDEDYIGTPTRRRRLDDGTVTRIMGN